MARSASLSDALQLSAQFDDQKTRRLKERRSKRRARRLKQRRRSPDSYYIVPRSRRALGKSAHSASGADALLADRRRYIAFWSTVVESIRSGQNSDGSTWALLKT